MVVNAHIVRECNVLIFLISIFFFFFYFLNYANCFWCDDDGAGLCIASSSARDSVTSRVHHNLLLFFSRSFIVFVLVWSFVDNICQMEFEMEWTPVAFLCDSVMRRHLIPNSDDVAVELNFDKLIVVEQTIMLPIDNQK